MKPHVKIWVACSGGVDSIVLTHLLHTQGFRVGILHCNFQLRGNESDGDEEFVRGFAKQLDLEIRVKKFDTPRLVKERKSNTQIVARDLRYNWFGEILQEGNNCIALGHHFDDQIETFLIQLERGGGIRGLCAMPKVQDKFIRPLLDKDRAWILDYAKTHGITWREDSSNVSTKYKRNYYRHNIVQDLNFHNGKIEVSKLVLAFQTLQNAIALYVSKEVEIIKANAFLPFSVWNTSPLLIQKEILYQLNISRNQTSELTKLMNGNIGSTLMYEELQFIKESDGLSLVSTKTKKYILETQELNKEEVVFNRAHFFIDPSRVKGDLHLRKWKEGDRFSPLGLKGTKRVSKYLNDLKITAAQKKLVHVITDNEGIIAVEHGAPSNRVKISQSTKKVLRLTIREL
ncbi:tRNA lysidine(34) synthetase TilS [Lishizhenia sp.]|uniref:tRNA lysidine(34) synthetase TilS n=1 Tax=Lishizhenia sp. TaxID=2497594 RepID=UPI00299DCC60|nr:tRNA lysidine(34) synthetase TilS [Lishizhenia sp.]MDX1445786.1 tRNA lysidine(34) synthetase TilS [Lishizhenia sp.]